MKTQLKKENQLHEWAKNKKVLVIGSGIMGSGIAQTFAQNGKEVYIIDTDQQILQKALQQIKENLELFAEMDILDYKDVNGVIDRINPTLDLESASHEADFIVEAVYERLDLKKEVFIEADRLTRPHIVLASNTSNMSIEEIASVTRHPYRVVGTHWVNPPHIMQLVEIIQGPQTSEETMKITRDLLNELGKSPVVCKDTPLFFKQCDAVSAY